MFHESRSSNCHLSATVSSGVHVAEMRSEMNENEEEKLQLRQRSEITENRVPECVLSEMILLQVPLVVWVTHGLTSDSDK